MENYKELISEFNNTIGDKVYNQIITNGIIVNSIWLVVGIILLVIGLIFAIKLYRDYKKWILKAGDTQYFLRYYDGSIGTNNRGFLWVVIITIGFSLGGIMIIFAIYNLWQIHYMPLMYVLHYVTGLCN